MARKVRVQYSGAIYHVMNRGDHRDVIFRSDQDRELFLKTLGEACGKTDWQIHACCLMSNHFHLVVETPRAKLLRRKEKLSAFRWSSYPQYLKRRGSRPVWLRVDRLLGEHGIPKDSSAGRSEFERRMEWRRSTEEKKMHRSS